MRWTVRAFCFLSISFLGLMASDLMRPSAAYAQDLSAYASFGQSGGGFVMASRPMMVRTSGGEASLSCTGQAVSTYEDPTINMTVSLSGPTGQLAYESGGGTGYLQDTVTATATDSYDDEAYSCYVFAWNNYVTANATDSGILPPQPGPAHFKDKDEFAPPILSGQGNYLKQELFGFTKADDSDYAKSAAISESYTLSGANGCNISIITHNGMTNDFGEVVDKYGNPQLANPSDPNYSFTCPSSSCSTTFTQTATFAGKSFTHNVTFTCSNVTWNAYTP